MIRKFIAISIVLLSQYVISMESGSGITREERLKDIGRFEVTLPRERILEMARDEIAQSRTLDEAIRKISDIEKRLKEFQRGDLANLKVKSDIFTRIADKFGITTEVVEEKFNRAAKASELEFSLALRDEAHRYINQAKNLDDAIKKIKELSIKSAVNLLDTDNKRTYIISEIYKKFFDSPFDIAAKLGIEMPADLKQRLIESGVSSVVSPGLVKKQSPEELREELLDDAQRYIQEAKNLDEAIKYIKELDKQNSGNVLKDKESLKSILGSLSNYFKASRFDVAKKLGVELSPQFVKELRRTIAEMKLEEENIPSQDVQSWFRKNKKNIDKEGWVVKEFVKYIFEKPDENAAKRIIYALVLHGKDLGSFKDEHGQTLLDLAKTYENDELIKFLSKEMGFGL